MPYYIVETTATTEIRERWAVLADDFEDARDRVENGDAAFIEETVLPNERNREHYGTSLAGTREAEVIGILNAAGFDTD